MEQVLDAKNGQWLKKPALFPKFAEAATDNTL
jgi:hypothetical protein